MPKDGDYVAGWVYRTPTTPGLTQTPLLMALVRALARADARRDEVPRTAKKNWAPEEAALGNTTSRRTIVDATRTPPRKSTPLLIYTPLCLFDFGGTDG